MDFTLSKEQKQIIKAARKFAMAEFPQRAVEFDGEEKFDLKIWKKSLRAWLCRRFYRSGL